MISKAQAPFLSAIAIAALTFSACGGDSAGEAKKSKASESSDKKNSDSNTSDQPGTGSSKTKGKPLAGAMRAKLVGAADEFGDRIAYRATGAVGITMDMGGLGGQSTEADLDEPLSVTEIDADGEIYSTISMGSTLGSLASAEFGDLSSETWFIGNNIYFLPSDDFSRLLAQTGRDPGPFAAGLGVVHIDQVEEELRDAWGSNQYTDPIKLGAALRENADKFTVSDDDPNTFEARLKYKDVLELTSGTDPDEMIKSLASSMALGAGPESDDNLDFEKLAKDMLSAPADLTVTLSENGALSETGITLDMSLILTSLMESAPGIDDLDDEQEEELNIFLDSEFTMTTLTRYEVDPTIDVVAPTGEAEDRTEAFRTYFAKALSGQVSAS